MNELTELLRSNYGIALTFLFNGESIWFSVSNDIITIEGELAINLLNTDPSLMYDTIKSAIDSVNNMTTPEMMEAYFETNERDDNETFDIGMN